MSMTNLKLVENTTSPALVKKHQPLLFKVKSAEFKALVEILGNRIQARLIQKLEGLFKTFGKLQFPLESISTFITHPTKKCLKNHMHDISERTLRSELNGIRANYRFKKNTHLYPSTIDFAGKYYATYYTSKNSDRAVLWFRNAPLLDDLMQQVEKKVGGKINGKTAEGTAGDVQVECMSDAGDLQVVNISKQLTTSNEQLTENKKQEKNMQTLDPSLFIPAGNISSIGKTKPQSVDSEQGVKEIKPAVCQECIKQPEFVNDLAWDAFRVAMNKHYPSVVIQFDRKGKAKLESLQKAFSSNITNITFSQFLDLVIGKWDGICRAISHARWEFEPYIGHPPTIGKLCFENGSPILTWYRERLKSIEQDKKNTESKAISNTADKEKMQAIAKAESAKRKLLQEGSSPGFTYKDKKYKSDMTINESLEEAVAHCISSPTMHDQIKIYWDFLQKKAVDKAASYKRIGELLLEKQAAIPEKYMQTDWAVALSEHTQSANHPEAIL